MRRSTTTLACCVASAALAATPSAAWFTDGHRMIARAAVELQPDSLPSFFRQGAGTVAHAAADPDLMKHDAVPALAKAEAPEHYLDSELLGSAALPPTRYDYLAMLVEMELAPDYVGLLPYALVEAAQRLTMAFAQHRAVPASHHVQTKALLYAGLVAHYAGDLGQPLHTTIHHNGRALEDGSSPMTGFHYRVDPLVEKVPFDRAAALEGAEPRALGDLFQAIVAELERSNRLVDATYELEPLLERFTEDGEADPRVVAFTAERFRATVTFLASIYLTAWEDSAAIELQPWEQFDEPADGGRVPARLVPVKPSR